MSDKIIVTGHRRSGTTFIGRMLSLHRSVSYVHEPLNHEQGLKGLDVNNWFPYFTSENISQIEASILKNLFSLKYADYKISLGESTSPRFIYNADFRDLLANIACNFSGEPLIKRAGRCVFKHIHKASFLRAKYNPFRSRTVFKDPGLVLSSDMISRLYNTWVVAVLRHPAAYFLSMKQRAWAVGPEEFLTQPDLMREYLEKYRGEMEGELEFRDRILLEWVCIAEVLYDFIDRNERFVPVRHEDVCKDPLNTLGKLYRRFKIPFTKKVEESIISYTSANKVNAADTADIKRNSNILASLWKEKLSIEEIRYIKDKTYHLAKRFYPSDKDWA